MMKKSLLALAVAALSANAFAVNLDDNTGIQKYASEINVAATGTTLANAAASVSAGFALATDAYARFDLTNGATFAADPTPGGTWVISAGGKGYNYVILRQSAGTKITDTISFTASVAVTSKNAVGITYGLYETAANAVAKTGNLSAPKSGTLLSFASGLIVKNSAAKVLDIDAINADSKKFDDGTGTNTSIDTTPLGTLTYAADTNVLDADGNTVTTAILSAPTWKLQGNFSAVKTITATTASGFTPAPDKQSATLASAAPSEAVGYVVTTSDRIAETPVTATFSANGANGYTITPVTLNVANLKENGDSDEISLLMNPQSVFKNFVRITNKSTVAAPVKLTLTNDAGDSVTVSLGDVAGQSSASIPAQGSSSQLDIKDIYAAAEAKGLNAPTGTKLRLRVTAPVGDGLISAQAFSPSNDYNSFNVFKN